MVAGGCELGAACLDAQLHTATDGMAQQTDYGRLEYVSIRVKGCGHLPYPYVDGRVLKLKAL